MRLILHPSLLENLNSRHCSSTPARMSIRLRKRVHHPFTHPPLSSSTILQYVSHGRGVVAPKGNLSGSLHRPRPSSPARRRSVWPPRGREHLFSRREPDGGAFPESPFSQAFCVVILKVLVHTLRTSLNSVWPHSKVASRPSRLPVAKQLNLWQSAPSPAQAITSCPRHISMVV